MGGKGWGQGRTLHSGAFQGSLGPRLQTAACLCTLVHDCSRSALLHLHILQITSRVCDVLSARCAAGGRGCEVEVSEAAMRITLDLIGMTGYG